MVVGVAALWTCLVKEKASYRPSLTTTFAAISFSVIHVPSCKQREQALAQRRQGIRQAVLSPVEARAMRLMGEEIAMLPPLADRLGFLVPAHTPLHHQHRQQLAVAALAPLPARLDPRGQIVPPVIDQYIVAQAEVGEIGYDHGVLRLDQDECLATPPLSDRRTFVN